MSNVSITLSFDDLLSKRVKNLDFFEKVAIDVNGTSESLSSFLVGTSLALSMTDLDYSAIAALFSSALKDLGISMDETGMITLELTSFSHYVQTESGISAEKAKSIVCV